MYEVGEFTQMMDPHPEIEEPAKTEPEILKYLQDCGHISLAASTIADLTRKELATLQEAMTRQRLAQRRRTLLVLHRATRYSATQSL
jgi:hypothetical protein